jgi:hypothetical protein
MKTPKLSSQQKTALLVIEAAGPTGLTTRFTNHPKNGAGLLLSTNTLSSLYALGLTLGTREDKPHDFPYILTDSGRAALAGEPWKPARFVYYLARPWMHTDERPIDFLIPPTFDANAYFAYTKTLSVDERVKTTGRMVREDLFRRSFPNVEIEEVTCLGCGDELESDDKLRKCKHCEKFVCDWCLGHATGHSI